MLAFPEITAFCAGILGLISFVLAFHVGSYRGKTKISLSHGGNQEMLVRIRKHGNFTEYVPLALILLGLLEMSGGAGSVAIWILGGMLVIGRITHPMGLVADNIGHPMRAVGALLTILMTLVCSGWLIYHYVATM